MSNCQFRLSTNFSTLKWLESSKWKFESFWMISYDKSRSDFFVVQLQSLIIKCKSDCKMHEGVHHDMLMNGIMKSHDV